MTATVPASMPWKCTGCGAVFNGPMTRPPSNGCPECGSHACFDINVNMAEAEPAKEIKIFTFAGPN